MEQNGETSGIVFNIQRFSLHDGPGIRTLVFTKGCPLNCRWCSNPEGIGRDIEVLCNPKKCIGCNACLEKCPVGAISLDPLQGYVIDRQICDSCGDCARYCPTEAKKLCGERKTVKQILDIVKRDKPFYNSSGGGVTIGGGEALSQPEFTYEIVKGARELGVNTAIETSGFGLWGWLSRIAGCCDTILYDIKAISPALHRELTGQANALILGNLTVLDKEIGKMNPKPRLVLRIPLIPGCTATEENLRSIAHLIKEQLSNYTVVELLPFHNFGEQKYAQLDLPYEFSGKPNMQSGELPELVAIMEEYGLPVKVSKW